MKHITMILAVAMAAAGMYAADATSRPAWKAQCSAPVDAPNNWMDVVRYRGPAAKLVGQKVYGYANVYNKDGNAVTRDGNDSILAAWALFVIVDGADKNLGDVVFLGAPGSGPGHMDRENIHIGARVPTTQVAVRQVRNNWCYITGTITGASERYAVKDRAGRGEIAGDFTRDVRLSVDSIQWWDTARRQLSTTAPK